MAGRTPRGDDHGPVGESSTEERNPSQEEINSMLRSQVLPAHDVLILNEDHSDIGSDEELVFEEVDDDEAERLGMDRFVTPSDSRIRTTATIVVQRRDERMVPKNPLLSVYSRKNIIKVPASKLKETLNQRFHRIQNRVMKRSLTQEQALFNYLKMNQEAGYEKAFGHRQGLIARLNKRLTERGELQATGEKQVVMTDKIMAELKNATAQDHESFWREQVMNWMQHYEWKRDNGPVFSKDELDQQIEEWMSQKGNQFETAEEMVENMDNFMAKKGFTRADADQLDADLDNYWSKKGQKSSSSTKSADDLDKDLDSFVNARKSSSGSAPSSSTGSVESLSGSSKSITPFMRSRLAREKQRQNMTLDDLEKEMDLYAQRRAFLKQKEVAEKRAQEEAAKKAVMAEGDKFDDEAEDFGMNFE